MPTAKMLDEKAIPRVYIEPECLKKVSSIVRQCPTEVAWMGIVEEGEYDDGTPYITMLDCYIPSQEVGAATCDIDAEGMATYAMKLIEEEKDPTTIQWWGHSHVNMGVGPSGTDMTTFKEHIENLPEGKMFLMTIHNKKGEYSCALYLGNGFYVDGLTMRVDEDNTELDAVVAEELEANTRKRTYAYTPPTTSRSNPANGRGPNQPAVQRSLPYSGRRSDRVEPGSYDRKNGNERRNAMGF